MDYIIQTQFEGPGFVAVPNSVAQMAELGAEALGVLVWLASLPKGYAIRRSTICERFGLGRDKWQRIARDLAAVGALDVVQDRVDGGRFARRYVVRWPSAERAAAPGPGFPAPVEPAPANPHKNCGKPAEKVRETRSSIKTKEERHGVAVCSGVPKARAAARHSGSGDGAGLSLDDFGHYGLDMLREGRDAPSRSGVMAKAGSERFEALRAALREADRQSAEKGRAA